MLNKGSTLEPWATGDQARFWLSALAESAEAGFIGTNLQDAIVTWNKGAERLFGYAPEEILGRPIATIIPPEKLAEQAAVLTLVRAGETCIRLETERLRKNGRTMPVSLTIAPVHGERGQLIGVSIIAGDLRRAQLVEAELLRREAVLCSILDIVPDALIIIGEGATIESFSTAAELLFGYAREEVIGRTIGQLMPSPYREAHDEYVANYFRAGERPIIGVGPALVGQRKNGSTFPMELSVGEMFMPGVPMLTVSIRDLTTSQDREHRLAELQAELVHVARLNELGQMVLALAHEVNQPLAALTNYLSGTRRLVRAGRREAAEQAIELAAEQANRATQIIQRLRDLVRKGETDKRVEELPKIIQEAIALALVGITGRIELDLQVSPDAADAMIDKVQIQQVLLNLVRNAAEAMAERRHRKLSIGATRAGDMIEVSVIDNGPGLGNDIRARLFQPFVTTKPQGMGVGLSVCRRIVEAHGGRIWADEAVSDGAAFRFTIPCSTAAVPD